MANKKDLENRIEAVEEHLRHVRNNIIYSLCFILFAVPTIGLVYLERQLYDFLIFKLLINKLCYSETSGIVQGTKLIFLFGAFGIIAMIVVFAIMFYIIVLDDIVND